MIDSPNSGKVLQSSGEKDLLQEKGTRVGGRLSTKAMLEVVFEMCVTGFEHSEMTEKRKLVLDKRDHMS